MAERQEKVTVWDSLIRNSLQGNRCCGKPMKKVAPWVRWCTNCGDIESKWTLSGKTFSCAPDMTVCATCDYWGPEKKGFAKLCLKAKKQGVEVWTTPGMTCELHPERE